MKSEVKLETPQKVSCYNSVSYKFVLKSVKSQNRICLVIQYQFKASACKIWWTKTKLFFWETKTIFPLLEKLFLSIGVSYKFLLKSIKRLNRIFWAQEDSFKALECQIWSINTKSFFWESEAKLGTILKLSLHIGFIYIFVWKSVKSLNQIFRAIEYCYKTLQCQIWLTNTNLFSRGNKSKLETHKNQSPYIGVSFKFLSKSVKTLNRIFSLIESWFQLQNVKFARRIQNQFPVKTRQSWNISKKTFRILKFPITLF